MLPGRGSSGVRRKAVHLSGLGQADPHWSPAQAHLLDVGVVLSLGSLGVGLLRLSLLRHARPVAVLPSTLTAVLAAPRTEPPPAALPPPIVLPRHPGSGRVRRALEL